MVSLRVSSAEFGPRALIAGLVFALGILLLIQWTSYRATQRLVETSDDVALSQRILIDLEEIVARVQDAQRGARGFVITGDEAYLEPFHYGSDRLPQEIDDLSQLTADSPLLQRQLRELETLVGIALLEFRQVVDARRDSGFRAAQQEVVSGEGKQAMDDIRRLVTRMKDQVQTSLAAKERATRAAAARVTMYLLEGSLENIRRRSDHSVSAFFDLISGDLAKVFPTSERFPIGEEQFGPPTVCLVATNRCKRRYTFLLGGAQIAAMSEDRAAGEPSLIAPTVRRQLSAPSRRGL